MAKRVKVQIVRQFPTSRMLDVDHNLAAMFASLRAQKIKRKSKNYWPILSLVLNPFLEIMKTVIQKTRMISKACKLRQIKMTLLVKR